LREPAGQAALRERTIFRTIVAIHVNQLAISLASPLTICVVLASGPVLIFLFQLTHRRAALGLAIHLGGGVTLCMAAIAAGAARRRAIRTKVLCE
jgi:hypothetical protein